MYCSVPCRIRRLQNYELPRKLPELAKLGYPLLVGTSREGFLGATLARNGRPAPPEERLWATAATVTASILGGAHIVRVHDVVEMAQVARVDNCACWILSGAAVFASQGTAAQATIPCIGFPGKKRCSFLEPSRLSLSRKSAA